MRVIPFYYRRCHLYLQANKKILKLNTTRYDTFVKNPIDLRPTLHGKLGSWDSALHNKDIRNIQLTHESIYFVFKHENKVYSGWGGGIEPAPKKR